MGSNLVRTPRMRVDTDLASPQHQHLSPTFGPASPSLTENGTQSIHSINSLPPQDCGVGLHLKIDLDLCRPRVTSMDAGSAAAVRKKIAVGDLLTGIKDLRSKDYIDTQSLPLAQINSLLYGAEGTGIALRFKRLETVLKRAPDASASSLDGAGWEDKWTEYDCALRRACKTTILLL